MNSTETIQLVRYVAALFPAVRTDPHTADAWHDVLHRYPIEQARAAAVRVSERQTFCSLADIVAELKRTRAVALDGFRYVPVPGDDDPTVYLAARREQLAAVAAGHRAADPEALTAARPRPVAELTAATGRDIPEEL
ncbi:hypothetical protein [Yinghuangia soli]|uniref:Replicative helicase inhibitor G39P N-terminal domain-containing protein n=1 Tax=Yinghuangia soli TaxID=2908204 RepID=A0AA41Q539_9ACTN|nr:hypothetical protein [Yinghuangia soli]MCF2531723.1 hypothetical protein [Yinghuangia soli]